MVANAPIKRGRKFDQVLDGARQVFLSDGYEGASVDNIARAAAVSKATLYSYFPDKRTLFMQFAGVEIRRMSDAAAEAIDTSAPADVVLRSAAGQIVRFYLSDFGQAIYRICVAEAARFPELGRQFYETGMKSAQLLLRQFLSEATKRGELNVRPEEIELAAYQFSDLCRAGLFNRRLFCVQTSFTADELDRVISGAVDTFLARYGPPR